MKIKGLRWFIIGLIFIATVINYIDRSALAIMWGNENVAGSISQSLGLNKDHYSYILNVKNSGFNFKLPRGSKNDIESKIFTITPGKVCTHIKP